MALGEEMWVCIGGWKTVDRGRGRIGCAQGNEGVWVVVGDGRTAE